MELQGLGTEVKKMIKPEFHRSIYNAMQLVDMLIVPILSLAPCTAAPFQI